jgi:hypothetical protein
MTPIPTLYLRFIERQQIVDQTPMYSTAKTIKVLQQFWEHADGQEAAGDMFVTKLGTWKDVPLVKE